MRTLLVIECNTTLFVDILGDPTRVGIRRKDISMVILETYEIRRLIDILTKAEKCVAKVEK